MGPLEDVLFRIASPAVRDAWPTEGERALYVLIKERKFGAAPTLADAALYGVCMMLEEGDPRLLAQTAEPLVPYLRRVESHAGLSARP